MEKPGSHIGELKQLTFAEGSGAMFSKKIETRKAIIADIPSIKSLADSNKKELGFITRSTISEAIHFGQIMVITIDGSVIGFQHYNHRKRDGQTTLYHKVIDKKYRGQGLGTILVNAVVNEARELGKVTVRLKCPVDLPSNQFHERYGFKLIGQEQGKKRSLNIWEFTIDHL